jgi:hypothetical protein
LLLLFVCFREELAGLNRSIQSTAKAIKGHLEALSRDKAALPEQQQAKLRKLMQDFAGTLQVGEGNECVDSIADSLCSRWCC